MRRAPCRWETGSSFWGLKPRFPLSFALVPHSRAPSSAARFLAVSWRRRHHSTLLFPFFTAKMLPAASNADHLKLRPARAPMVEGASIERGPLEFSGLLTQFSGPRPRSSAISASDLGAVGRDERSDAMQNMRLYRIFCICGSHVMLSPD